MLVGGGGRVGSNDSRREYSDVFPERFCRLDVSSEDSVVRDEVIEESSLWSVFTSGVIVSDIGREAKRPCSRGWLLQASVDN